MTELISPTVKDAMPTAETAVWPLKPSHNPHITLPIPSPVEDDLSALVQQPIALGSPSDEVARFLQSATAASTRRSYLGDVRDFLRWGGMLPTTPMQLAQYIAERASDHKPSTIMRRIVGIARFHAERGHADPSKSEVVRRVMRGIRREHQGGQRKAAPLMKSDLLVLLGRIPVDTHGLRDRALLLLGFASALRRSELVALDVADLVNVPEGLTVALRRSKTDQLGKGRVIAVPRGRSANACPVEAVRAWLAAANIEAGPVFRSVAKGGAISAARLTAQSVSLVIKRHAQAMGLPAEKFSGHSLRAGLVTSAAQAGVSPWKIQEQTGHKSMAILSGYVRDALLFEGNAAGAVL